jgi:hypothetical protein
VQRCAGGRETIKVNKKILCAAATAVVAGLALCPTAGADVVTPEPGTYNLVWTNGGLDPQAAPGTPFQWLVTSCGPDCIVADNPATPTPGIQYYRTSDGWISDYRAAETTCSVTPQNPVEHKIPVETRNVINADFTKWWTDSKENSCFPGDWSKQGSVSADIVGQA